MSADLSMLRDRWEQGQRPVFEISPDKELTCVITEYDSINDIEVDHQYRMYAYFKIGNAWQVSCDVQDGKGETGLLDCLDWIQRRTAI